MNKTCKILLAFVCLSASLSISAQVLQHTISNGETVYSIARRYNINVNDLLKANPSLGDGNRILVGQKLNIPSSTGNPAQQGSASAQATPQTPPAQGGYLNSGIKEMYRIKKKDNLYGIAQRYNLTVEELAAANPPLTPTSKIKKDDLLYIPFSKEEKEASKHKEEQAANARASEQQRRNAEAMASMRQHIRMGVLLPFKDGNDRSMKMVEFYRGVLMAADSLKKEGTTIEIHTFHSGSSAADMYALTNKESLKQMNVIFGPLDAAQAAPLSEFCRQHKIRLVMPFATTNSFGQNNPYVYQITSTGESSARLGAQRMIKQFSNNTFVIMKTDAPDNRGTRFTNEMSAELSRKGFPPQAVSLQAEDEVLAASLSPTRQNVIMTDATSLNAATAVTRRLTTFLQNHPEYNITLIGYPEWATYAQNLSNGFHTLDTYIYTNFYRNPNDSRIQNFETRFTNNFQQSMNRTFPRYGLMGFDLAYYFLHGMAQLGDFFDEKQNTLTYYPLQNPLSFAQQSANAAHINQAVWLIHFTTNRQVEILK